MNVFDFDKTIYDGDSTADFFRFCLHRQPGLSRFLPRIVWGFSLYFLGVWDKTRAKQNFYRFLRAVPDVDGWVSAFWESYLCRIKSWYPAMQRGDDVIISASPEFLLAPACRRLGIFTNASRRAGLRPSTPTRCRTRRWPGSLIAPALSGAIRCCPGPDGTTPHKARRSRGRRRACLPQAVAAAAPWSASFRPGWPGLPHREPAIRRSDPAGRGFSSRAAFSPQGNLLK